MPTSVRGLLDVVILFKTSSDKSIINPVQNKLRQISALTENWQKQ